MSELQLGAIIALVTIAVLLTGTPIAFGLGIVAMGDARLGKLSPSMSKTDMLRLYAEKYPEEGEGTRATWASQMLHCGYCGTPLPEAQEREWRPSFPYSQAEALTYARLLLEEVRAQVERLVG